MPNDLDQLAQDADHQDKWGAPPTNRGLQNLADQQSMTHQPEQPNPAAPYLQGARDIGQRMFVDPLKATGFLPQEQTPPWYGQAQQFGGQLFRQGPMPMAAGMFPRGGLAQIASDAGVIPQWMNDNVLTHALRSPAFTQATQFFTPLIGTLTLAQVPNARWSAFPGRQFELRHRETGEKRGDVWLNYDQATKNVTVEYFQSTPRARPPGSSRTIADPRRWALGNNPVESALELRSALPEVFNHFPDMKTVSFTSVGGTRGAQSVMADLQYAVTRTPGGVEWKRIKHIPDLSYRQPLEAPRPPPSPQPATPGPSSRPMAPPPPLPAQQSPTPGPSRANLTHDEVRARLAQRLSPQPLANMTRDEVRTLLNHLISRLDRL